MQRQLSLKMQQENNELHRSTIQLQAEMDANVARMTMSSAAYDQMAKEQQIRSNFAKKRADLEKSSASMGSAFYKSQSDVLDKEEQKQLSIVRNGARDKAQVEGSWTEGLRAGLREWGADATNIYAQVRDTSVNAMDGMANSIWQMASRGKSSFKEMALADLQVPHSGNKALKMSAGQSNLVGQEISITQGRTYRMGVWAKQDSGTTIKDAGNTKFRVADSTGLLVGSNYGPFSSGWQLVTFDWKATKTTTASFQLTTFLSAGAMYFDDFRVLDVTDEKDIAANAGAISQMNTRVTAAEGAITTQAQQLTKLSGELAVTNAAVSQKAEQSAVTGLTTRMSPVTTGQAEHAR